MSETFDFGAALDWLKYGKKVARTGWNGKGMWLCLILSKGLLDESGIDVGVMQEFIAMKTIQDSFVPWQPSQTDMLAEDWLTVE